MSNRFFHILLCFVLCASTLSASTQPEPAITVHIPMRDGLELTTDLYYPSYAEQISDQYPCILLRLPAGRKAETWRPLAALAEYGYVVAIQDTRSALDSEGKTVPYLSDGWGIHQDGYDTVNWLASSSFTNGTVGTAGFSAAGFTQIMLAPTAPSALKCQYIGQAGASLYHHAIFPGGRLQKHQVESWLGLYAPHPSVKEFVANQPTYNEFWKNVDALTMSHKVEAPALHYGGWYDPFLQGTIDTYAAIQDRGGKGAKANQKLLIGPWNHFWPKDLTIGDYAIPENGKQAPVDLSPIAWFNYYLKGVDNGISKLPKVTYYVMGAFDGSETSGNVWRHSDVWPVPAVETSLYLTADKQLQTEELKDSSTYSYLHDPADPVPTVGGRNLFLPSGPRDQRQIEQRNDVLVFTTPPLNEDWEVTGRVIVKVFVSPELADADLSVRLTDVYPDGKSLLIAEGLVYAAKAIDTQSESMEKGPVEIPVDLWSTSVVFSKGHSIRISVSGSNYPRHELNALKVEAPSWWFSRGTTGMIYVGGETPSRLLLPVVRKGDRWLAQPQGIDLTGKN